MPIGRAIFCTDLDVTGRGGRTDDRFNCAKVCRAMCKLEPGKEYLHCLIVAAELTEAQIEAAERLCGQLRDWQRPLAALEKLQSELPSFDVLTTLLKTTAVNGRMATKVYALVAVAAHVQEVIANASDKAGIELVEKIADFKHKNKTRANVSFASKFAHFFIDPDRFPIKDSFSTKMIEFHLGTANCVQTKEKKQDESYTAFVHNIEKLKLRDGLDQVSNRRLDRYLWFAGKLQIF